MTPDQYGNVSLSPAGQYNGLFGGNPDLDVETADTFTAGVVFNMLDTMQLSVDWWSIEIEDTIDNVFGQTSLDQCIAGSDQLCENINRGVGGSLWLGKSGWVVTTQQNIGTETTEGVDIAWAWALGDSWKFDLIGVYLLDKTTTPLPDAPETSYDCTGVVSPQCYVSPEWRHTGTVTYDSNGWWALTGRWRYIGSVDYDGTTDEIAQDTMSDQNYFDLNAVFRFMDTHDVTLGVNNLLDEEPPLSGNTLSQNGNTYVGFYDSLGRYLYADVTLRW